MNLIKTFRIIVGILLLINTVTIFALLFLEIESLVVFFEFGVDIDAQNIGEAIAEAVANMFAGFFFLIGMFIIGILNAIIYTTFGVLTLTLKRAKVMPIIVVIFTGISLYLGIRAFMILVLGDYPTLILPLRIISDFVVVGLSITNFILIIRAQKIPRLESSN
jgi:hypothetical protein